MSWSFGASQSLLVRPQAMKIQADVTSFSALLSACEKSQRPAPRYHWSGHDMMVVEQKPRFFPGKTMEKMVVLWKTHDFSRKTMEKWWFCGKKTRFFPGKLWENGGF